MMIVRNLILIIIYVNVQFGFSQKGSYIGINLNAFPSRYFSDFYYLKRMPTGYGYSVSLGGGQYGKRVFDNKTKDLFGRKYRPYELGENYYKTDNAGLQGKYSFSYQFILNKKINLDFGFCGIIGIYRQKSEFDDHLYNEQDKYVYMVVREKFIRINFALGFELETLWKTTKKLQILTGFNLPFYTVNQNNFGILKGFDPPLLGMEPIVNVGIRYQLHK